MGWLELRRYCANAYAYALLSPCEIGWTKQACKSYEVS